MQWSLLTLVDDDDFHSLLLCCCHYIFNDASIAYGVVIGDAYSVVLYSQICYMVMIDLYAKYGLFIKDYCSSYVEQVELDNMRSRRWVTNKD